MTAKYAVVVVVVAAAVQAFAELSHSVVDSDALASAKTLASGAADGEPAVATHLLASGPALVFFGHGQNLFLDPVLPDVMCCCSFLVSSVLGEDYAEQWRSHPSLRSPRCY